MANALDYVMELKKQKDASEKAQSDSVQQAISNFAAGAQLRQQQQKSLIDQLTLQATLAKSGLRLTPEGGLVQDPSLLSVNDQLNQLLKLSKINNYQRQADDPYGTKKAIAQAEAKEQALGVSSADAGRESLAKEGIKNVLEMRKLLFPDGTPESFSRSTALKRSAIGGKPIPNSEEGKRLYRLGSTAITGRQLISTGVAARPEETRALMDSFVANAFSSPKDTYEGLQQLEDFYNDFLKTSAPNRYESIVSEVYPKESSNSDVSNLANQAAAILAQRRKKK